MNATPPNEASPDALPQARLTPMLEQYMSIKAAHPNALLLYRMGDFYELFFDDAITAAKELQIVLTSRNPNAESPVPMAGVPHHALKGYVRQLLEKGYNVAICDQVENPREAKGLVKRAVTRILTPGTVVDDENLFAKGHNYLGALCWNEEKGAGGFAWLDYSTGFWSGLYSTKPSDLWQWVQKMAPAELLVPDPLSVPASLILEATQIVRVPERSHFDWKSALKRLLEVQGVKDVGALGLERKDELVRACGALLTYVLQTQQSEALHLEPFTPIDLNRHLVVDEVTERNLEIFRCLDGKKGAGTLWHVLDHTLTPMGGRLLEERLRHPWREAEPILDCQSAVEWFLEHDEQRRAMRSALDSVHDLERLSTRIFLDRASPRDFAGLRQGLQMLPRIRAVLESSPNRKTLYPSLGDPVEDLPKPLRAALKCWDDLGDYTALLEKALVESPPPVVTEGGLFRQGFNSELDELLELSEHGEGLLSDLLDKEQKALPAGKLKLGVNRVFGYYFEMSRAAGQNPPPHFIRRQSLANAERFVTDELSKLEERIFEAADKRKAMEYQLFQKLRKTVADARPRIQFMATLLAGLDYWQALAEAARKNAWKKPEISADLQLFIREGRHPVVEQIQGAAHFIPNDVRMDEKRRVLLITGPNMAGKSTILRQTAIICLLAQMGSFVPAAEARLGLADRVFTRVGASDNLAQGRSTFMVEMMETARILRQATRKSLVILDEIGRGTSTFDGLAIAWAVLEELAQRGNGGIRTLFATHYHELTVLESRIPCVHNMNIAIVESNGEIVFLHRLVPGPADKSYGVEVARLAGVPNAVVQRARTLLRQLQAKNGNNALLPEVPTRKSATLPGIDLPASPSARSEPSEPTKCAEHPLVVTLRDMDPNRLTPLDAIRLINEWKLLWAPQVGVDS